MSDYGYCPECGKPGVRAYRLMGQIRCLNGHRYPAARFNPPDAPRVREQAIEQYFCMEVERTGGETRKVKWLGNDGAPDRLAGWPARKGERTGRHALVELKRPKGMAEAHQAREHRKLRAMGFVVVVLTTREEIDEWVKGMTA